MSISIEPVIVKGHMKKTGHRRGQEDDRDISKMFIFVNTFSLQNSVINGKSQPQGKFTYNTQGINNNGINMQTPLFIRHLDYLVHDEWT